MAVVVLQSRLRYLDSWLDCDDTRPERDSQRTNPVEYPLNIHQGLGACPMSLSQHLQAAFWLFLMGMISADTETKLTFSLSETSKWYKTLVKQKNILFAAMEGSRIWRMPQISQVFYTYRSHWWLTHPLTFISWRLPPSSETAHAWHRWWLLPSNMHSAVTHPALFLWQQLDLTDTPSKHNGTTTLAASE